MRAPASIALVLSLACIGRAQAPATLTPAQMREDLAWFRTSVLGAEKSHSASSRAEAEKRLARLESSLDTISSTAFEVALTRVVALANNGHSNANAGGRARRTNRVPLRFTTFQNEFRVMRAAKQHADLLGARLISIDGKPVTVVRDSARTLFGGTSAWRDRTVPYTLESPEQLNVLGITRGSDAAEYVFETDAGKRISRRLAADAPGAPGFPSPDQLLYSPPLGASESGWVALPPMLPWSLGQPQTFFRWRMAPEADGMVIQLRRMVDGGGVGIRAFLAEMTDSVRATHPRNIVVDMRLNGGGDLNNARDFMKALPALVPGRIFVLTGPSTFSAAISSVGYLKQAGGDKVVIVGEEVGDRLVFFAEGRPQTAPNSGMQIGVATERHDYMNGCKVFTDCHRPVVANPIAVPTLKPDIAAPLTFADWIAGRDPAMEAVRRALANGRKAP